MTLEFCQDPSINEATRLGHMLSLTFLANILKTDQWLTLQQKSVAEPEMESRFSTSVTQHLTKVSKYGIGNLNPINSPSAPLVPSSF